LRCLGWIRLLCRWSGVGQTTARVLQQLRDVRLSREVHRKFYRVCLLLHKDFASFLWDQHSAGAERRDNGTCLSLGVKRVSSDCEWRLAKGFGEKCAAQPFVYLSLHFIWTLQTDMVATYYWGIIFLLTHKDSWHLVTESCLIMPPSFMPVVCPEDVREAYQWGDRRKWDIK